MHASSCKVDYSGCRETADVARSLERSVARTSRYRMIIFLKLCTRLASASYRCLEAVRTGDGQLKGYGHVSDCMREGDRTHHSDVWTIKCSSFGCCRHVLFRYVACGWDTVVWTSIYEQNLRTLYSERSELSEGCGVSNCDKVQGRCRCAHDFSYGLGLCSSLYETPRFSKILEPHVTPII